MKINHDDDDMVGAQRETSPSSLEGYGEEHVISVDVQIIYHYV